MGFARAIVRPASVFLLVAAVVAAIILFIGFTLLALHPGGEETTHVAYVPPDLTVMREEFLRPDLMAAFLLSLAILVICAALARPRTEPGFLDHEVAIG